MCKKETNIDLDVGYDKRLIRVDFDDLKSYKTMMFLNNSDQLFAADGLWTARLSCIPIILYTHYPVYNSSNSIFNIIYRFYLLSANRFFALEDLMKLHKWECLLHVEGDNLLFGPLGMF